MADQKSSLLRVLIPVGVLVIGLGLTWAALKNQSASKSNQQATGATGAQPAATGVPAATGAAGATAVVLPDPAPVAPPAPVVTPAATGKLRAQVFEGDPATEGFAGIGSVDEKGPELARVEFSTLGAGIKSVTLARVFETIKRDQKKVVQAEELYTPEGGVTTALTPMAANAVEIDGQVVSLLGYYVDSRGVRMGSPVWRQLGPGSFEAFVEDEGGARVARIARVYTLAAGTYDIRLAQHVENLSGRPLAVRWLQFGPVEVLERETMTYGGDKRKLRFGYLMDKQTQLSDPTVLHSSYLWPRTDSKVIGPEAVVTVGRENLRSHATVHRVWPNETSIDKQHRLVWAGMVTRYFGAAMHTLAAPGAGPDEKELKVAEVSRILLHRAEGQPGARVDNPLMFLSTVSESATVAPGEKKDFSVGLYAGPLSKPLIEADEGAKAAGLGGLVSFNWGGPCAWCTFEWMTALLLWLLRSLHGYVVFDWGLGIIVLVLIVRTLLHRVTRFQQIKMARFGKQMQAVAPKQKKLQERYAGDTQKLREETAKLWREEGVNPMGGAAGCLPAMLQTPIWIGLSSMLFFAFDLRHQPAFFGVFQTISGGKWLFLADLAEPDRFVHFGRTLVTIPMLGPIDSLNILPILLGIVFFIQQKYLTPPSTGQLSPEQEQQQKIMKWMMVLMFPLLMYAAPSGLSLYFIMNSTLAIIESRYIRSHIDKYDLLNTPKKSKPGGFMARLQAIAEERQRQMMQGKGGRPPRKKV
jgi:YidC/Oxa1 family membrane protein insertase